MVEFTFIPGTRDPETEKPLRGRTCSSLFPLRFPPPYPPPFSFLLGDPLGLLCLTHYCLQVLTFLRSGLTRRRPLVLESLSKFAVQPLDWSVPSLTPKLEILGLAVLSGTEFYPGPLVRFSLLLFCYANSAGAAGVLQ